MTVFREVCTEKKKITKTVDNRAGGKVDACNEH